MRSVNNRKWLSNISKQSMKANKKRNVILIIAISLTAFMMTTVFSVAGSLLKGIEKSTMYQVGSDYHGGFKYLTQKQYDALSKDHEISDLSCNIIVGRSTNEELREDYTEIRYTDEKNAIHSFALPEIGTLPQKENEIATCTKVLDDFGIPHKIGEKIHLSIDNGMNEVDGEFVVSGIWEKPTETLVNQIFVSKEFQEKFSPTWKDESDMNRFMKVQSYAGSMNPGFNFDHSFNISNQMKSLKERLDFGSEVNDGVNWAYTASAIDVTTVLMIVFIVFIIFLSGYLIISNIFNISVTADIHLYGLLKTIGTTNKLLKKILIREAFLLSVIAIPIGLVCGYFVSIILIPLIIRNMIDVPVATEFNVWFFVISALFSWITVRMSCVRPFKIIKKISPVEAVRYIDHSNPVKCKKKKMQRITPFTMAWGNIGRNKKKSVSVIISIALSIIIFNITVSLVESFDEDKYLSDFTQSDFTVADGSLFNKYLVDVNYEGVSQNDIEYFKGFSGVENSGSIYMSAKSHKIDNLALDRVMAFYESIKDDLEPYMIEEIENDVEAKKIHNIVYGLDEMVYQQLEMDEGVLDWETFKSGKYVIVSAPIEGSEDDAAWSFYKIGEMIDVEMADGTTKSYEVIGIGKVPYALGCQYSKILDINVILPSNEYLANSTSDHAMKFFMNVDDSHIEEADVQLIEYCDSIKPKLAFESRNTFKEGFKKMQMTFFIIGSAFSLILALIGILNFINLTYTSINERRSELKVLNAVGMTRKQIKNMLTYEGVIRVILSFIVVFTVGIGLNYFVVNTIAGQMIMFNYRFVVWPMVVSLPLYVLIAIFVPRCISWQKSGQVNSPN